MAISGSTAVVGAPYQDWLTTPWAGPHQQAELTPTGGGRVLFGWFVAISGDTAVVGTPDCPGSACPGAAFVFVRSGQTWTQQAELTASDGAAHDDFGYNVAISGDTVVVGAAGKDAVTGAAYVFVRSGQTWTQQAELTASDGVPQDFFGGSVAISGLTAVVGALGVNSSAGAVYVFENVGGVWSQQAELAASDSAAEHYFGSSVALSGTTMLVGASEANRGAGAAYVFAKRGGIWSQQGPKLVATDGSYGDEFSRSVAVAGSTAVVGAPLHGSGTIGGAAYVFARSGGTWSLHAELTASDATAYINFGYSVATSGSVVLVGAYSAGPQSAGAAYLFEAPDGTWSQVAELTSSDSIAYEHFGFSVAMHRSTAVIGAPDHGSIGAAYVFANVRAIRGGSSRG